MNFNSTNGREFLGAGVAFPMGIDAEGKIALHSLEDQVKQSILIILQTAKGERVMRPDFGCGLDKLVFAQINSSTVALVEHEVKDALIHFEPRIDVLEVKATADSVEKNTLLINLTYRVRTTDNIFNLVYPFYIERGTS